MYSKIMPSLRLEVRLHSLGPLHTLRFLDVNISIVKQPGKRSANVQAFLPVGHWIFYRSVCNGPNAAACREVLKLTHFSANAI